jgi:hypothetical protein
MKYILSILLMLTFHFSDGQVTTTQLNNAIKTAVDPLKLRLTNVEKPVVICVDSILMPVYKRIASLDSVVKAQAIIIAGQKVQLTDLQLFINKLRSCVQ